VSITLAQRRALVAGLGLLALVSASGVTVAHVFHQPSLLKYAATVAAPLVLVALVAAPNPLALMTGLLVVAAPFAGYVMTVAGTRVPLLAPVLVVAAYCAAFSQPVNGRRSALSTAGVLMVLALIVPLAESATRSQVLATLASLFAAAWLAARAAAREDGMVTVTWGFLAAAVIQAALALWQRSTGHQLNLYGSAGLQSFHYNGYFFGFQNAIRPPGAFYDPISLGNMLAIAVPLTLGLIVRYGRRRDPAKLALALAGLAIVIAGLVVTLDRMSWIAALLGLATVVLLLPGRQRRRVLVVAVLAVGVLVLLGGVGSQSTVGQRAASIIHPLNETGTGNGDVLRIEIWQRAVAEFRTHPLSGVGLGRFQGILAGELAPAGTQGHAHSTYLQLAVEGGILALLGLLAVIVALRLDLRLIRRMDPLWGAALTGGAFALLACWITDVTIRYSGVATYMGVLFGLIAGRARAARASAQRGERRAIAAR
jgi:O-antigen ligase